MNQFANNTVGELVAFLLGIEDNDLIEILECTRVGRKITDARLDSLVDFIPLKEWPTKEEHKRKRIYESHVLGKGWLTLARNEIEVTE